MEFNGKADEDVFHEEHGNVGDHVISDDLARQVATVEHQDRFMQALRKCLNAAWSVLLSICTIMGVYKIILMSSFFAQPAFKERSGTYKATSDDY
ncbi:hypothetical protein F1880_006308 [Penicillium rolfsii]|nr:hypothetical protein F1880_006308 [Penicillium rolfsii]